MVCRGLGVWRLRLQGCLVWVRAGNKRGLERLTLKKRTFLCAVNAKPYKL